MPNDIIFEEGDSNYSGGDDNSLYIIDQGQVEIQLKNCYTSD
jgi:hypothetical protein